MRDRFDDELGQRGRTELILAEAALRDLASESGPTPLAHAVAGVLTMTADHLRYVVERLADRREP